MIASKERHALGMSNLQQEEQLECFDAVVASIDEVTHENVVLVGHLAADVEELQKVEELAMEISTNNHWQLHWLNIVLLDQNL